MRGSSRSPEPAPWPEPVERVAAVVRAAGVDARIEELPRRVQEPPGTAVDVSAFEHAGRTVVVLSPAGEELDLDSVRGRMRPTDVPAFPYRDAQVVVDRSLLLETVVWLEAGSPRHFLALAPTALVTLTRAETTAVTPSREVHDRGPG